MRENAKRWCAVECGVGERRVVKIMRGGEVWR